MTNEEIEEIVLWNLSFGTPIEKTLKDLDKQEFIYLFQ